MAALSEGKGSASQGRHTGLSATRERPWTLVRRYVTTAKHRRLAKLLLPATLQAIKSISYKQRPQYPWTPFAFGVVGGQPSLEPPPVSFRFITAPEDALHRQVSMQCKIRLLMTWIGTELATATLRTYVRTYVVYLYIRSNFSRQTSLCFFSY